MNSSIFKRKKGILFDFDGTIVDSMRGFAKIASEVIAKYYSKDKQWGYEKYMETSGIPFFEQLEELFPNHPNNSLASSAFETTKKLDYFRTPLYLDTLDTLRKLRAKGIKVGISSNNFQELVDGYSEINSVEVDINMGYKDGFAKGRAHFEFFKNKFDIKNSEILFVGDSLKDGERASQAGIDFIGKTGIFKRAEFEQRFPKSPVIEHLSELLHL